MDEVESDKFADGYRDLHAATVRIVFAHARRMLSDATKLTRKLLGPQFVAARKSH